MTACRSAFSLRSFLFASLLTLLACMLPMGAYAAQAPAPPAPTITSVTGSSDTITIKAASGLLVVDEIDMSCANLAMPASVCPSSTKLAWTQTGKSKGGFDVVSWSDTQVVLQSTSFFPGALLKAFTMRVSSGNGNGNGNGNTTSTIYTLPEPLLLAPRVDAMARTATANQYTVSGATFGRLSHLVETLEDGTTRVVQKPGGTQASSAGVSMPAGSWGENLITVTDTGLAGHKLVKISFYYLNSAGTVVKVLDAAPGLYFVGTLTGASSASAGQVQMTGTGLQAVTKLVFTLSDNSQVTVNVAENTGSFNALTITSSALAGKTIKTIVATIADNVQTMTLANQSVRVKDVAPFVTITSPFTGQIVSPSVASATFTLGGGPTAGTTCQIDTNAVKACTSPFSLNNLSAGSHKLTIIATGVDGQTGTSSVTFNVAALPTVTITSGPADGDITGPAVTYGFSSTNAYTTRCQMDSTTYAGCTSPRALAASVGNHTFTIFVTDLYGNSVTATRTFTVVAAPTLSPISGTPASPTTATSANLAWTESGGSAVASCTLDGAASPCTSPVSFIDLTPGDHTFVVKLTNASGTATQSTTWHIAATPTVDFTAGPAENASTGDGTAITWVASAAATSATCKLDSGAAATCAVSGTRSLTGLADGPHSFTVTVKTDENITASVTRNFKVVNAPTVVFTTRPASSISTTATAAWTTTGQVDTTTCRLDSAAAASCTSPQSLTGLSVGDHTLTVKVSNSLNAAAATDTVTWTVRPAVCEAPAQLQVASPSLNTISVSCYGLSNLNQITLTTGGGSFTYYNPVGPNANLNPVDTVVTWTDGKITVSDPQLSGATISDVTSRLLNGDPSVEIHNLNVNAVSPPIVSITAPANGSQALAAGLMGTFTLTGGPASTVTCKVDAAAAAACTSPLDLSALAPGAHTLTVAASGKGGVADPASVTFTVQASDPTFTSVKLGADGLIHITGANLNTAGTVRLTYDNYGPDQVGGPSMIQANNPRIGDSGNTDSWTDSEIVFSAGNNNGQLFTTLSASKASDPGSFVYSLDFADFNAVTLRPTAITSVTSPAAETIRITGHGLDKLSSIGLFQYAAANNTLSGQYIYRPYVSGSYTYHYGALAVKWTDTEIVYQDEALGGLNVDYIQSTNTDGVGYDDQQFDTARLPIVALPKLRLNTAKRTGRWQVTLTGQSLLKMRAVGLTFNTGYPKYENTIGMYRAASNPENAQLGADARVLSWTDNTIVLNVLGESQGKQSYGVSGFAFTDSASGNNELANMSYAPDYNSSANYTINVDWPVQAKVTAISNPSALGGRIHIDGTGGFQSYDYPYPAQVDRFRVTYDDGTTREYGAMYQPGLNNADTSCCGYPGSGVYKNIVYRASRLQMTSNSMEFSDPVAAGKTPVKVEIIDGNGAVGDTFNVPTADQVKIAPMKIDATDLSSAARKYWYTSRAPGQVTISANPYLDGYESLDMRDLSEVQAWFQTSTSVGTSSGMNMCTWAQRPDFPMGPSSQSNGYPADSCATGQKATVVSWTHDAITLDVSDKVGNAVVRDLNVLDLYTDGAYMGYQCCGFSGLQRPKVSATAQVDYPAAVKADNPIGYFRFEDAVGSTTATDEPGTTMGDGVVSGGATFGADGVIGKSITLDGTGKVSVPATSGSHGAFTVEFWMKQNLPISTGTGNYDYQATGLFGGCGFRAAMLAYEDGSPGYSGGKNKSLVTSSANQGGAGCDSYYTSGLYGTRTDVTEDPSSTLGAYGATAPTQAQWKHVIISTGETSAISRVMIDGRVVTDESYGYGTLDLAHDFVIGSADDGTITSGDYFFQTRSAFRGQLDEFAVYDHALTVAQMRSHYRAYFDYSAPVAPAPNFVYNKSASIETSLKDVDYIVVNAGGYESYGNGSGGHYRNFRRYNRCAPELNFLTLTCSQAGQLYAAGDIVGWTKDQFSVYDPRLRGAVVTSVDGFKYIYGQGYVKVFSDDIANVKPTGDAPQIDTVTSTSDGRVEIHGQNLLGMQHVIVGTIGDSSRQLDYTVGYVNSENNYCKSQQAPNGRTKAIVTATETLVTITDPECLNGATVDQIKGMSFMGLADPMITKNVNTPVQSPAIDTSGTYLEVTGGYRVVLHRPQGGLLGVENIALLGLDVQASYWNPSSQYASTNALLGKTVNSWTDTEIDVTDPIELAGGALLRRAYLGGIGPVDFSNVSVPDVAPVKLTDVTASADGTQLILTGENLDHLGRFDTAAVHSAGISGSNLHQTATVFTSSKIVITRSSYESSAPITLTHITAATSNSSPNVTVIDQDIDVQIPAMATTLPELASSPAKGTLHVNTDMTNVESMQLEIGSRIYKPGSANASQNPSTIQISEWDANGVTLVAPITFSNLYIGVMRTYAANGSYIDRIQFKPVAIQSDPTAITSVTSPAAGQLAINGTGLDQVDGVTLKTSDGALSVYNPNGSQPGSVLTAAGATVTFTPTQILITSQDDLGGILVSKVTLTGTYGNYLSAAASVTVG